MQKEETSNETSNEIANEIAEILENYELKKFGVNFDYVGLTSNMEAVLVKEGNPCDDSEDRYNLGIDSSIYDDFYYNTIEYTSATYVSGAGLKYSRLFFIKDKELSLLLSEFQKLDDEIRQSAYDNYLSCLWIGI